MTYTVILTDLAIRQLRKLDVSAQQQIRKALEKIKVRPHHFTEQLVSSKLSKLRVGNYRVLMRIDDQKIIIVVIKIAHRKVVYRMKK